MSNKSKEWIWIIWSLLGFTAGPGHGYTIIEGPKNTTVLVGSVAQFNCTVSDEWKILIWLFNGLPKLSVLGSGTPIQTDPRYTQRGHFSGSEFTSELMINDVQLNDSGRVTCSLQNDASESAFLSVQESGKNEDDWRTRTIILAVVLSVVGLLLLILIILLIICCCKRRKESNYQKELRKVSEKKTTDRNVETMKGGGHENYGYSPDIPRQTNEMAGVPASSPINPSYYDPEEDLEVNPASEVPYDERHEELPSINPRNIRNVTIV